MNRREKIKLTVERIKVARNLVWRLAEFIDLARAAGYEPVHAGTTLRRYRFELSAQRKALTRLTKSSQKDFPRRTGVTETVRQRAA